MEELELQREEKFKTMHGICFSCEPEENNGV